MTQSYRRWGESERAPSLQKTCKTWEIPRTAERSGGSSGAWTGGVASRMQWIWQLTRHPRVSPFSQSICGLWSTSQGWPNTNRVSRALNTEKQILSVRLLESEAQTRGLYHQTAHLFGFFQFPFLPLGLYRRWASLSCPTPTVTMPTVVESQATWSVPAWLGEERTPARWGSIWTPTNESEATMWRTNHNADSGTSEGPKIWNMCLFSLLSDCKDQLDWVCVQMFSSHWKTRST